MTLTKTKEDIFLAARQAKLLATHLIPGQTDTHRRLPNYTPIDQSLIGYIADGDTDDINAAVTAARTCFNEGTWASLAPHQRKHIMLRWLSLLTLHAEELAALDCVDAGKPISECLNTDMPATLDTIQWYAELLDKRYGRISPTHQDATGLIVYEPMGVVGVVLPWNFPAQMYAWKVAPALAAGNSVIVKPAELTSLSAYRMTQLAHEAGIPEGALTLVTGLGETAGRALGLHHDVDMVAFTGSTEVGRHFLRYSADSNLKEIVLECGGKSPQIIFEDAPLDSLVDSVLAAAFWNMSENCSCGSRLLVHTSIKAPLLERLKARLNDWKLGLPTDPDVMIGPMVEQAHFDKVLGFIKMAQAEGARLVHGGTVHETLGSGWYIEPTIFDDVTPEMSLFQQEVFGPVLAVTTFNTEEEAIALANHSDYGLAASVYTLNIHRAQRLARAIRAGTVSVNGFSEGDITTPFGGFKQSGFGGRDKGVEALEQYQQVKTIWYVNQ